MKKAWTVAMALVIVVVVAAAVIRTVQGEPIPVLSMIALAGWSMGYGLARLAEAWGIQLWDGR